jgi:hypothetical protein
MHIGKSSNLVFHEQYHRPFKTAVIEKGSSKPFIATLFARNLVLILMELTFKRTKLLKQLNV